MLEDSTATDYGTNVIWRESQVRGLSSGQEPTTSSSCPTLAHVLEPLDIVKIHQHLDVVEVCLGWERNNRYSVLNTQGEQILYIYEEAQCYTRQCYGSLRKFRLTVTDNEDIQLLHLHRPFRCSSRCCYFCCCLQEMIISETPDILLGTVRERWTCCLPEFEVENEAGDVTFKLEGSCCHCHCCCSISFVVRNSSGDQVAVVKKDWGGFKALIGASNDFVIEYMDKVGRDDKVLIFGAAFLLDFNYFERHGKCF